MKDGELEKNQILNVLGLVYNTDIIQFNSNEDMV